MGFIITQLFVYPVKSLGGISLDKAELAATGLKYDRQFMIVDENGRFLTQREHHELALLKCSLVAGGVSVRSAVFESGRPLMLSEDATSEEDVSVVIWNDNCRASACSAEADAYFSDYLKRRCRLVRLTGRTQRKVDGKYDPEGNITSFSDGYPILLIGSASLDDLNARLSSKGENEVGWDRFRPNIVVRTDKPFEEDDWKKFNVSDMRFSGVKLCGRCVMTTINQESGITSKEPLKTLASFRTREGKVYFGQNVLSHQSAGTIHVGQEVLPMSNEGF